MDDLICPLCQKNKGKGSAQQETKKNGIVGFDDIFECDVCRGVHIDRRLVLLPKTLGKWTDVLGAVRELRSEFNSPPTIHSDGSVTCPDMNGVKHSIERFPSSIRERANKLLLALVKKTEFFGATTQITENDYPLAYVSSAEELNPYVEFLVENRLITRHLHHRGLVSVTAHGFEVASEAQLLPELTVFLSSTCYDLRDCRCELAVHLDSLGCNVLQSDDPLRFNVSHNNDSIESCLLNVANSNLVLCLIDQRYGPPLPKGPYEGLSATHAEIRFAFEKQIPVYFFIRREAFTEWSMLKRDASYQTNWVEPKDPEQRKRWTDFVSEYAKLPSEENVSNWFDQFDSIVDLKKIVESRVRAFRNGRTVGAGTPAGVR